MRLTIKVKVGIPESFKLGRYRQKITGSSHLKSFKAKYHYSGTRETLNPFKKCLAFFSVISISTTNRNNSKLHLSGTMAILFCYFLLAPDLE